MSRHTHGVVIGKANRNKAVEGLECQNKTFVLDYDQLAIHDICLCVCITML